MSRTYLAIKSKAMLHNWKSTTWGELATLEYGKGLIGYENANGDYPVYGTNGMIGLHTEPLFDKAGVIIGRKGAYRGVHYSKKPFYVIDTAFYLKPKTDIDLRWAYYQLLTLDINSMDSGSAIPSTSRPDFYALPVLLPSLPEQRAIAGILGALDDKVELNRRMNRTLESMARAVFRQWFVESDDVGDWEEKPLYEYAEYINGAAYRDFDFSSDNSGLPIIKIAEIKNGITNQTKYTNKQMDEKYRILDGDILFAWSGSPDTSIDTFIWVNGEGWLNQHIFKVIPPDPSKKWFTYLILKHFKEIFIEIARDKQTTGLGHVTVKDLNRLMFAYPPDKVVARFSEIVDPIMERLFANEKESRTLASLRDSLLPKLMRGEVRVKA